MTAPTQPPDPQLVTQLARAIQTSTSSGFAGGAMIAEAIDALITERLRVLVEELGGREGPVMPVHSEYVRHERRLFDALVKHAPVVQMSDDLVGDVVKTLEVLAESLNACRAQQRENAETIAALKERAETAEAANMELDNARKSAEQSARDLRADNARLRAQLDAMTGEQVPVIDVFCKNNVCMFGSSTFPSTLPDGVHTLYRHPAPAQPVVVLGEVFVFPVAGVKHVSTRWIAPWDSLPEGRYEFTLGAPLSTEGGK